MVTIADDLVALHSSDPATVHLSSIVRMRDPDVAAVEAALYDERSLVRHHAMRRTIWVMSPAVAVAAHASSTRKIAAAERRKVLQWLAASPEVDDPERWLADATARVLALVAERGTVLTREIGQAFPDLTIRLVAGAGTRNPTPIPAHTRVPLLAAFEGRLIRARPVGTWTSGQYAWALLEGWSPGFALDGDVAPGTGAAELLARLLRSFGPATDEDLRWWTGWTKGQTSTALTDVDAVEVDLEGGGTGWVAPDDPILDASGDADVLWVAVLPSLDPTAMGWKRRDWYLSGPTSAEVFDRWGNAGPTIWAGGRIVGGWAQRPDGELAVELLADVPTADRDLLDTELDRIARAVGTTRFSIRFPSPSHRRLTA